MSVRVSLWGGESSPCPALVPSRTGPESPRRAMATPDVSMHMEEVVVVTTPDTAVDGSGMEEVKTVLVTTNLAAHG